MYEKNGQFAKPSRVTRRKALKSGSALLGTGLATGVGTAKKGNEYVGYAYDPKTLEIQGRASARLTGAHDNLRGVFKLNGLTIPANQQARTKTKMPSANGARPTSRFRSKKGGKFKRNGKKMDFKVISSENYNVAGVAEYPLGGNPGDQTDECTAFVVKPNVSSRSEQKTLNIIKNEMNLSDQR